MKKALIFILLFIVSIAVIIANPIQATQDKGAQEETQQIGYVDMQQLFQDHPQKKASEEELETAAETLKEELKTRSKTMDKEARQELLKKYQDQLSRQETELIDDVLKDINQKVSQVAQEKELSIVLDKSAVIYGGHNLTEIVSTEIKNDYEAEDEENEEDDTE
ncbi:MAG: OmpH family outer membrane protein [Halanaerobacter sp.]